MGRAKKQTGTHKTNQHTVRNLHKHRLVWYAVFAAGLVGAHFSILPTPSTQQETTDQKEVLVYATNVNVSALVSATNQARAANGLGALALNSQLSNGAQSKAADMIAKDYWAHTAPDGTEPWDFFTSAGYKYQNAGENLAYGFDNSTEIVDAWMNSPGHRANILGDYKDVGFGYASGENYQGGQYTVVVGFYATAQTPPAPKPAPKPTVSTKPAETTKPLPKPEPEVAVETKSESVPISKESKAELVSTDTSAKPEEPQSITNLQNILNGNAGWPMYASLAFIGTSMVGFTATHIQLIKRGWRQTRHFALVHPALDIAILTALIVTLFTTAVGFIR
jgi:uncharacterized protein YkwD